MSQHQLDNLSAAEASISSGPKSMQAGEASYPEWRRTVISFFILLLLTLGYLSVGAVVFSAIEEPPEKEALLKLRDDLTDESRRLANLIVEETLSKVCPEDLENCQNQLDRARIRDIISTAMPKIFEVVGINTIPSANSSNNSVILNWDLAGGYYFAFTIITTIGYGTFTPTQNVTRVLVIFYAIIGIPLFVYLCGLLSDVYCVMCFHLRRLFRYHSGTANRIGYYLFTFSVAVAVLFVSPFLVLPSNQLDFVTTIYFIVVTLTTIGFGDVYPIDPAAVESREHWFRYSMSVLMFVYALLGLSLFASFLDDLANIPSLIGQKFNGLFTRTQCAPSDGSAVDNAAYGADEKDN